MFERGWDWIYDNGSSGMKGLGGGLGAQGEESVVLRGGSGDTWVVGPGRQEGCGLDLKSLY